MKQKCLILPILSLAAAAFWIIPQRIAISKIEATSALLARTLATISREPSSSSSKKALPPRDWRGISAIYAENDRGNGIGNVLAVKQFEDQLDAMPPEELIAAIIQISDLHLPNDGALFQRIVQRLYQADPRSTLTALVDHFDSKGVLAANINGILQIWAEADPQAAGAWFDEHIRAGKFDSKALNGKNQSRLQFETVMIGGLISTDPAAAQRRLIAIPEQFRRNLIHTPVLPSLAAENQSAYAKIIRETLPASEQFGAIIEPVEGIALAHDLPVVAAYLDRVKATPEERSAAVEDAVYSIISSLARNQKLTREKIDGLRAAAETIVPGTSDYATGTGLATATMNHDIAFRDGAALALYYHENGASDEVLISFLSHYFSAESMEQARALAAKISDPASRRRIFERME